MTESYGAPNPMVAASAAGPPTEPPPPQQLDPHQLSFIFTAGISTGVMLLFVVRRMIRRLVLRAPLKSKLDVDGHTIVKRGSFFGWLGMIMTKISLRSFYAVGVPSVGSMIMIFLFMGIAAFAILFLSGLDLDDLADRFG